MFSLVEQWKTSKMTQQQFCAEHDLKVSTFAYWVARHKQAGTEKPANGFVGVDVSGLAEEAPVRIAYPNSVVVSCPASLPLISRLIHLA